MGRHCASCGEWCYDLEFSGNQWRKGPGVSRCMDYVSGSGGASYKCHECCRTFHNQNEINMHMQVHRPRNVSCPVCGETRFRSGANAVQHVESGYCRGCRGKDNARQQIYDFARRKPGMNRYLTETPLITYGAGGSGNDSNSNVPKFPYQCPDCHKAFRQLSQLLQHQDQKHRQGFYLGY